MKKIIIHVFILLFVNLLTHAQDTSLYQGRSDIYLWSGKILKQTSLWKIDSLRVQYVNNGNLSEVLTEDVHAIATNEYEINFDEKNHVTKKLYDLIINTSGDTIKGFIKRLMVDNKIEYMPSGGKNNKIVAYKSYILNNNISTKPLHQTTEKSEYAPSSKAIVYPSAKDKSLNKDLIITKNNDSILCTILNADLIKIDYVVRRHGRDTRAIILKTDVMQQPVNTNAIQFKPYDSTTSASYQSSNADFRSYNFDQIITLTGDIIWCTIINESDADIYYHIAVPDHDVNFRISKNLVKEYFNNHKKAEQQEEIIH